jgi:hypothetical protein
MSHRCHKSKCDIVTQEIDIEKEIDLRDRDRVILSSSSSEDDIFKEFHLLTNYHKKIVN